jgi:hypothetical protein
MNRKKATNAKSRKYPFFPEFFISSPMMAMFFMLTVSVAAKMDKNLKMAKSGVRLNAL